ncbi:glycosyltransferase [Phycicoccus ginsengisoli]
MLHTLLRVTMISDVVERHDVEQFPSGWRSPYLVRHRWTSRLSQILPDGVIAISRTLEGGYAERRPVLRIPPLIDMAEYATPSPRDPRDPLTLLYIGSPSNKDQLGVLVDAVMDQDGAPRPILLRVAGTDSNQLAANEDVGPDRVSKFGNVVQVLGRLEREEVLSQLREADFSVVLRPRAGYAQAGFPSKVPESLAAGCPLFANITSDLADYLRDLDNSVICETGADGQVTADAVATALRRANGLTDPELHSLRLRARETAAHLHYGAWAPALRAWLVTLS